jgi:hypothetical protein
MAGASREGGFRLGGESLLEPRGEVGVAVQLRREVVAGHRRVGGFGYAESELSASREASPACTLASAVPSIGQLDGSGELVDPSIRRLLSTIRIVSAFTVVAPPAVCGAGIGVRAARASSPSQIMITFFRATRTRVVKWSVRAGEPTTAAPGYPCTRPGLGPGPALAHRIQFAAACVRVVSARSGPVAAAARPTTSPSPSPTV